MRIGQLLLAAQQNRNTQGRTGDEFGAPLHYNWGMCRSIKQLRRKDDPATEEEIRAAALQFVRKVSGYRAPSQKNEGAFNAAVDDVAEASRRLIETLQGG